MRKILILLSLIAANFTLAQSDLDDRLTEFANRHDLYNKKLQKLETILEDYTLSEEERTIEWRKAYRKWDRKEVTDSILAEEEVINSIYGLHNRYRGKIGGYNFNYLLHRLNETVRKGKMSSINKTMIEQVLRKQWEDKPEITQDVQAMVSSIEEFFNKNPKLDLLCELIDEGVFKTIPVALTNFNDLFYHVTEAERNTFKQYLIDSRLSLLEMNLNLYRLNHRTKTLVGEEVKSFPFVLDLDSLKYTDFTAVPEINRYFRFRMILHSFFKYEREILNVSAFSNSLNGHFNMEAYDFLYAFEVSCSKFNVQLAQESDTNFNIQNFLLAAYNDIYYYLEQSVEGLEKWNQNRIDFKKFDLSSEERQVVDAILADNDTIMKIGLEVFLTNELYQNIEWNFEFKLACFFALYYKGMEVQNDWRNESVQLNPFGEEDAKKSKIFTHFDEEEWNTLKDQCKESLERAQYGNTRFIITYDGRNTVRYWPEVTRDREVKQIILKAVKGKPEIPYFRMIVETGEVEKGSLASEYDDFYERSPRMPISDSYYSVAVPPMPPPAETSRSSSFDQNQAVIVDFPDVEASFPGGREAMDKWILENMVYPEISRELGDQGRVYVTFVVEEDGSITGVDVMRGGITTELNREAKRLIRNMPKWIPGEVKGKFVRSRVRMPILFELG